MAELVPRERPDNPRYWCDFLGFPGGPFFDVSLWLSDRHWPYELRIDGREYYRRRRKRKRG